MSVDKRYDIELNGQGLMLATKSYKKVAESVYVSPRDLATSAGESPMSSFWWQKRFSDFSGGGGQKYAESKNAQENRILDSQDMDFSTPGEARLMKSMAASLAKTGTNGFLRSAASRLWLVDGTDIYPYNGSSWASALAMGITGNCVCMTDNGQYIFAAGTSGGIFGGGTTQESWASWATGTGSQPTAMDFINKQLYGVQSTKFYKLIAGASQSTELFDAGTGFTLNCITGHNQKIVFGGYKGSTGDERSYIWESDGTESGTTLLVDDLPDGFKIYGMLSYLDVLYIWGGYELTAGTTAAGMLYIYTNGATSIGGHFKEAADMGNPLRTAVPTVDTIPRCALADGQFVYFGMNERSGLWRYDLKEGGLHRSFSAATTNNLVTGVATYKGKVYLAYSGAGAFVEQTTYITSGGWLKASQTTFGTANSKLGRKVVLGYKTATTPTANYTATESFAPSHPFTSPQWTLTETGDATEDITAGILSINTPGTAVNYNTITDNDISPATGATFEFRAKIDSTTFEGTYANSGSQAYDCGMTIDNGTAQASVALKSGYVGLIYGETNKVLEFPLTTTEYHVYRLTLLGSTIKLYIDGVRVATVTGSYSSGTKWVRFGDNRTADTDCLSYWDYVRYWRTGAFAPGESGLASDALTVEVSVDDETIYETLEASDTQFKEYPIGFLNTWPSIIVKATVGSNAVKLTDITIEAVPTLPDTHYWEFAVPLENPLETTNETEENINAQTIYEGLETARANKIPVTFKDMDYDIATTPITYSVLIEELERGSVTIDDEEVSNAIRIKLREF